MMNDPELIKEKINSIKNSFLSALDDYKKYYVLFNLNPEIDENQNYYYNSKNELDNLSKQLFDITKNIEQNISNLNIGMKETKDKLQEEKKLNAELNKMLNDIKNTKNGSQLLIEDSKEEYNMQYYKNIEIFFGILIIGVFLNKNFGNKNELQT